MSRRFLIADTSDTDREELVALLPEGATALEAGSPDDALAALREDGPDIVLLAWGLPAAKAVIATAGKATRRVPVIVLDAEANSREAAMAAGAAGFLIRPVRKEALRLALAALGW